MFSKVIKVSIQDANKKFIFYKEQTFQKEQILNMMNWNWNLY